MGEKEKRKEEAPTLEMVGGWAFRKHLLGSKSQSENLNVHSQLVGNHPLSPKVQTQQLRISSAAVTVMILGHLQPGSLLRQLKLQILNSNGNSGRNKRGSNKTGGNGFRT